MEAGLASMRARFDDQAIRMDGQGALIQSGSRWTARMNEWGERMDAAIETRDQQISRLTTTIAELQKRIERLEQE